MERVARYRRLTLIVCSLILFGQLLVASTALSYVFLALSARLSSHGRPLANPLREARSADYPAGWWQRHRNEPDGYTLALPPSWRVVPLSAEAPSEAEAAADEDAVAQRLASWARERLEAGWGTWVATAADGPLGNVTTINIVREPLDEEVSVEDYARASVASLREGSGAADQVSERWLDLVAGRALRVQATYHPSSEGGEGRPLTMVQVYLVRDGAGYVVTGVTQPQHADGYTPIFDGIIRSLRWTS